MNQQTETPAPAKKPYVAPKLQVYGTITTLTSNIGMSGDWDNSGMATGNTKTF